MDVLSDQSDIEIEDDSVFNEFNMILNNDIEILEENDLNTINKQLNNLEEMFNKVMIKKINNQDNDDNIDNNNLIKKNNLNKGNFLKNLCLDIEEKIFIEATRGFNIKENVFKLRMDKLKEKFQNYNAPIIIGYIYRDFNNPKSFINEDIDTFWLNIVKKDNVITEKYLESNNKLLKACLKNFSISTKFKKKINDEIIRAFKKTVQIYNTDFIIDIIFYVKNNIDNTNI
jgi:hypothetical protein